MQRSTIKTANNVMIYGVTIIMNDCNFSLKDQSKRVQERFSFEGFYTSKQAAMSDYLYYRNGKVKNELSVSYGKYELRGRCEIYKASVMDGKILNHGITIDKVIIQ